MVLEQEIKMPGHDIYMDGKAKRLHDNEVFLGSRRGYEQITPLSSGFQIVSRCFHFFKDAFVQHREGMHKVIHISWN